jgi:2-polyprenyl-3-methyl-5-hydroxy-6-metoxy-1,4-benzoquinol methylase
MGKFTVNAGMADVWSISDTGEYKTYSWLSYMAHEIVWAKYLFWKNKLDLPANSKAIEVGCGYGKFSILLGLKGEKTTLMDYNKDALACALELHRWFHLEPECEAEDLMVPRPDLRGRYDVACSFGVLEHFSGEQRRKAFQATAEFLRPGGMLFFTVPNKFGFLYRAAVVLRRITGIVPKVFYENPYSPSELRSIASASDINILEVECIGSLKHDWHYWIGENAKSVMRRISGMQRPAARNPDDINSASLDISGSRIEDARSWWDKRFSSVLLFVGQKKEEIISAV